MGEAIITRRGGKPSAPNGTSWTDCAEIPEQCMCIYYDEETGLWFAGLEEKGGLYYSTNGKVWTQSSITNKGITAICKGNGVFVCATYSNGLYYSIDGRTWTASNISNSFGISSSIISVQIAFKNGLFVTCLNNRHYNYTGTDIRGIYYSTDGKNWTKGTTVTVTTNANYEIKWINGVWVIAGFNDKIYYSTNGKTWTLNTQVNSFDCLRSDSKNSILLLSVTGFGTGDSKKGVYYSIDGKNWTQITELDDIKFYDAYFSDGIWLAISSSRNRVYTSNDGKVWTLKPDPNFPFHPQFIIKGVVNWVVGTVFNGMYSSSDNGETWTQGSGSGNARYALCRNGVWVASYNGIKYSEVWKA